MITLAMLVLASHVQAPMLITKSGRVGKLGATMPSPEDLSTPAIEIKGDNITVDFGGATLRGSEQTVEPDQRKGLGIQVEGNNVTLKNLKVHGYKVGLIARNCQGLKIENADLSYNWKQHLHSTLEREDESDWMSYHRNEKDEWLGYGAGIYLRGCNNFEVKNATIEGGQCGLMLMECNDGKVWNSDFSFLSGIGLGLYQSSRNKIEHNNIDWCVRGYSHGVYNRGQDSAGILIYEQSNSNVFAYNSVTHGGDGFFLWAGQTTMDSGKGGCNDNLLYGNDFSHAPTNGIEATFSKNDFINNKVLECWHGIWGGYSYDSKVVGNSFAYNAISIAWEHGQHNLVQTNSFYRENAGIQLWQNKTQDPKWGYPKGHDTVSHDWTIEDNYFSNITSNALSLRDTKDVKVNFNRFESNGQLVKLEGSAPGLSFTKNKVLTSKQEGFPDVASGNQIDVGNYPPAPPTMQPSGQVLAGVDPETKDYLARFDVYWEPFKTGEDRFKEIEKLAPEVMKGGKDPFLKQGTLRGRRYILVDEWGPYDFRSPLLWPREPLSASSATSRNSDGSEGPASGSKTQRYEILGPKGKWKVKTLSGATLSSSSGEVPGFVDVTTDLYKPGTVKIELEYTGAKTVDYRGIETNAGKPVSFGYSIFRSPIDWNVKFFKWDASTDPRTEIEAFKALIASKNTVATLHTDHLDFAGSFARGVPANNFATVAEGTFQVDAGTYAFDLLTDDGARMWIDGKEVVSGAWKYQGPTLYTATLNLASGKHTIRVEHFQIDGYAALKVSFKPKS